MQEPSYNPIPRNPSLGLRLLTPIVPASDNRPALFLLTTAQCLFGLTCLTRRIPRIGEGRLYARLATGVRFVVGSYAILHSGFEYCRLMVPFDPWADEARYWRQWALKNGHQPSWWFGGTRYYTPMSIPEWRDKAIGAIKNLSNVLEVEYNEELDNEALSFFTASTSPSSTSPSSSSTSPSSSSTSTLSSSTSTLSSSTSTSPSSTSATDSALNLANIPIGPHTALKAAGPRAYSEIHQNLSQINARKAAELLSGDLDSVSELNKAQRLDSILEGHGHVHYNEQYTKPHVQLGTHVMESDDDFDMVWANFEPWEELRQETNFDIRLIPRWRSVDESV